MLSWKKDRAVDNPGISRSKLEVIYIQTNNTEQIVLREEPKRLDPEEEPVPPTFWREKSCCTRNCPMDLSKHLSR